MPIYEYRCERCVETVEILVRASEQPACPECGSTRLEKQLSVPASPAMAGDSRLPMGRPPAPGTCGRPQCAASGCMFEN